jgi:small-conductance mechanosensitive channel
MEEWLTPDAWIDLGGRVAAWFRDSVLTWPVAGQILVSGVALGISLLAAGHLKRWLDSRSDRPGWVVRALSPLLLPLIWLLQLWIVLRIARAYGLPSRFLDRATGLLLAWVVIRLVSQLVRHRVLASIFVWTAWTIAALNILGWLDAVMTYLGSTIVPGVPALSLLKIVQAVLLFAVLLSAAVYLTGLLEARIRANRTLSPVAQVLFLKSLRFILIAFAFAVAVASLGISLTSLAVFGGFVGIGVGFGLQRVISNLISGVVLLVDNSIKPGDIIAVSGTYGWVTAMGARYVSVVTRDGVEHLIPNETLITERVENWTHTQSRTRLKVEVGVHFRTDLHRAIELCLDAARETARILDDPEPKCLLLEFGDSAIRLQTRFWIADAQNGVQNVKSDVLLRIWEKFKQEGIEIPYPQRVLHIADPVLD